MGVGATSAARRVERRQRRHASRRRRAPGADADFRERTIDVGRILPTDAGQRRPQRTSVRWAELHAPESTRVQAMRREIKRRTGFALSAAYPSDVGVARTLVRMYGGEISVLSDAAAQLMHQLRQYVATGRATTATAFFGSGVDSAASAREVNAVLDAPWPPPAPAQAPAPAPARAASDAHNDDDDDDDDDDDNDDDNDNDDNDNDDDDNDNDDNDNESVGAGDSDSSAGEGLISIGARLTDIAADGTEAGALLATTLQTFDDLGTARRDALRAVHALLAAQTHAKTLAHVLVLTGYPADTDTSAGAARARLVARVDARLCSRADAVHAELLDWTSQMPGLHAYAEYLDALAPKCLEDFTRSAAPLVPPHMCEYALEEYAPDVPGVGSAPVDAPDMCYVCKCVQTRFVHRAGHDLCERGKPLCVECELLTYCRQTRGDTSSHEPDDIGHCIFCKQPYHWSELTTQRVSTAAHAAYATELARQARVRDAKSEATSQLPPAPAPKAASAPKSKATPAPAPKTAPAPVRAGDFNMQLARLVPEPSALRRRLGAPDALGAPAYQEQPSAERRAQDRERAVAMSQRLHRMRIAAAAAAAAGAPADAPPDAPVRGTFEMSSTTTTTTTWQH